MLWLRLLMFVLNGALAIAGVAGIGSLVAHNQWKATCLALSSGIFGLLLLGCVQLIASLLVKPAAALVGRGHWRWAVPIMVLAFGINHVAMVAWALGNLAFFAMALDDVPRWATLCVGAFAADAPFAWGAFHHLRPGWDDSFNGAEVAGSWASVGISAAGVLIWMGNSWSTILVALAAAFGISLIRHVVAFFTVDERNKMELNEILVRSVREGREP